MASSVAAFSKCTVATVLLLAVGSIAFPDQVEGDAGELKALLGRPVRIETTGGGVFQGTLYAVAGDRIELLENEGKIIQISRAAIESYVLLEEGDRRAFYQDSASNRLIVMPTGFAMEPGEFHVADQEIAVITASYGVSKNLSLWGGISPLGAVLSGRFILSISDSLAFTAGSFVGIEWLGISGGPVSGLLLPYLIGSYGEPDSNITVGAAAAFSFGSMNGFDSLGFVAALAGKVVLTSATAIVTENWIIWGKNNGGFDLLTIIGGLVFRIAGNRFSWDIGAIVPIQSTFEGPIIPIPWLSLTYRIQ
jgi:hypothetical protein